MERKNIAMDRIKITALFAAFLCSFSGASAQEPADSIGVPSTKTAVRQKRTRIEGFSQPRYGWESPTAVARLEGEELRVQSPASLVPAFNNVSGVRMEERSPGDYRLAVRSSLLRSPYGVRNDKIYYNGFSLTDAGGNTYLNVFNVADLSSAEFRKGPDGSRYGANSGGVVLLGSSDDPHTEATIYGGSHGLFGEAAGWVRQAGQHRFAVTESYQRADGYRQNSRHHRLFVRLADRWSYGKRGELLLNAFFSDLSYKTPGGLTLQEYDEDRRAARPGSVEQRTGVDQTMFFAGIRHRYRFGDKISHTVSVWYHYADVDHRSLANYQTRHENNVGVRTYLSYGTVSSGSRWSLDADLGYEGQWLFTGVHGYENLAGDKGKLQAHDDVLNHASFLFAGARAKYRKKLTFEASASVNFDGYRFRDTVNFTRDFKTAVMPHFGLNYRMARPIDVRFTVSRGYSPPSTAEVRPSDHKIYRDLQPEHGWNYEAGLRLNFWRNRIIIDGALYRYTIKDAIVPQTAEPDHTYFTNAGKIRQIGFELYTGWILFDRKSGIIRNLTWNRSLTWSGFKYKDYEVRGEDFSGNKVPGMPRMIFVNGLNIDFPLGANLYARYTSSGKIPLDDANTEFAKKYGVIYLRAGWTKNLLRGRRLNAYFAVDNLFNKKYTFGSDINAAGGRYYQPAPEINFVAGLSFRR